MKAIFLSLLTAALALAEALRPIVLRDLPLLFADDSGVAEKSGVLRIEHVANTGPKPVLEGTLPTEGSRVYLSGSVHRDEATGLLRMWYAGHPDLPGGAQPKVEGFRSGKCNFVLYATSNVGLRWDRPAPGLPAFQGPNAKQQLSHFPRTSVPLAAHPPQPTPNNFVPPSKVVCSRTKSKLFNFGIDG